MIEPPKAHPLSGRLIVVPHGPFHQLPFEAFRVEGEYVDARWSVVRTPLAGGEATLRRPTGATGVLLAGVELPELPELRAELEMVADLLAVDRNSLLLNPSRAELLAGMPGRRAIHLATHGRFREDNPAFSSLTVADGVVFMAELADLSLSADLVVLSACSTGRVFPGRGEDLAGVTHSFLAAGARNLVAPLWRIREGATRDWMAAFYRDWLAHGDIALAAQVAARSTRARWDHPYFWGAFTCHVSRL
ncbi:MAG: CHAT domain-containing protein [Candidatus Eisenbacteria bacterium]|nr:CHAT domain-containing protein [Candidatus Eisenbacteria bacterium]